MTKINNPYDLEDKIEKLTEQEAKQLLSQLAELLESNNPDIHMELLKAIEMATMFR